MNGRSDPADHILVRRDRGIRERSLALVHARGVLIDLGQTRILVDRVLHQLLGTRTQDIDVAPEREVVLRLQKERNEIPRLVRVIGKSGDTDRNGSLRGKARFLTRRPAHKKRIAPAELGIRSIVADRRQIQTTKRNESVLHHEAICRQIRYHRLQVIAFAKLIILFLGDTAAELFGEFQEISEIVTVEVCRSFGIVHVVIHIGIKKIRQDILRLMRQRENIRRKQGEFFVHLRKREAVLVSEDRLIADKSAYRDQKRHLIELPVRFKRAENVIEVFGSVDPVFSVHVGI